MKKSIGRKTLVYPHPVFVVGCYDKDDKPNLVTVAWGGIVCSDPPCVGISLRKSRYSYSCITDQKAFTVNIPSAKYVREADFAGMVSGETVNKFQKAGLTPMESIHAHAPYIKEFPVNLICRLHDTIEIGVHTQFIGEIVDVLVDEGLEGLNGLPMLEKVMPILFDSGQKNYYSVGEKLMEAYTVKEM